MEVRRHTLSLNSQELEPLSLQAEDLKSFFAMDITSSHDPVIHVGPYILSPLLFVKVAAPY